MKNILFTLALLVSFSSFGQTAEEYFEIGVNLLDESNYTDAILATNRAIELNPNFELAYNLRATLKIELQDFKGAISDFTKAIEISPNSLAYNDRGYLRSRVQDYKGAILDYTKAIELNSPSISYKNFEVPFDMSLGFLNRGNAKAALNDYKGAIIDFSKAIEFNSGNDTAYNNRGICKVYLRDLNGACDDIGKAVSLGNALSTEWFDKNCN